jgi:pimeloyl-ACP methyl ester carboxylesterase
LRTDNFKLLSEVPNKSGGTDFMDNFILVHGSWAGGSVWHKLIPLLEPHARVFTPTLSGFQVGEMAQPACGLHLHIQEMVELIEREKLENIVLVGHSYGGMVIQGVASRAWRHIQELVFLDAFVPENGQSLFDLLPEKSVQGMRSRLTDDAGRTLLDGANQVWLIPPPASLEGWKVFGEAAIWLTTQLVPTPVATFEEPVSLEPEQIPRSFLRCTNFPNFQQFEFMARNAGWRTAQVETGHFAQLEQPEEVAQFLLHHDA